MKVQYPYVNSDKQYCVTITREKLRNAFTSWANLEQFVDGLTQSLYNGAYIDRYNFYKGLVTNAYLQNAVQIEQISNPSSEAQAKAFVTKARELYLNMQEPTSDYNAWNKVGGYGRAVLTWSDPEDLVFLIRNDLASYIDVNVLADAFNIEKTSLLGRIKYVKDFNVRDKKGNIIMDGSNILGMMADKRWFRIKNQEIKTDEFYNANNRTWNVYLDDVNMIQFSLFSNAYVFATALPQVTITALAVSDDDVTISAGSTKKIAVSTTPAQANYPDISVESSASGVATATISGREITITGVASGDGVDGEATITVTAGNVSKTIAVTVPYVAPAEVTSGQE